jgi:hypothetical protein
MAKTNSGFESKKWVRIYNTGVRWAQLHLLDINMVIF